MALYGVDPWSRRAETFSVYFEAFSRLAVFERRGDEVGTRPPLAGLTRLEPAAGTVAVLAVMIGSITFDGGQETAVWGEVGPEFAGPLIDVCGHMLGLDDIERINNLPMRSGKMLLRTALTRLARHYGLLPPEHGEAEIARRIAGWIAEDGGVTLEAWRGDAAPASPSPRPYGQKVGMRGGRLR